MAHQYICDSHILTNGIVSVNAYDMLKCVTFLIAFTLYEPKSRLKEG